jgi:hypothetical protein
MAKPKLRTPQMLTKSPALYGTLRFTAARAFSQIHSVHALLYYVSNSLTSTTPLSPKHPCYVTFLHPNPAPFPALVPLAVHYSSPFISPHSIHSIRSAISFSSLLRHLPPPYSRYRHSQNQISNTISLSFYLSVTDQIS